jgi:hypothetical protein
MDLSSVKEGLFASLSAVLLENGSSETIVRALAQFPPHAIVAVCRMHTAEILGAFKLLRNSPSQKLTDHIQIAWRELPDLRLQLESYALRDESAIWLMQEFKISAGSDSPSQLKTLRNWSEGAEYASKVADRAFDEFSRIPEALPPYSIARGACVALLNGQYAWSARILRWMPFASADEQTCIIQGGVIQRLLEIRSTSEVKYHLAMLCLEMERHDALPLLRDFRTDRIMGLAT